MRKKILFSLLVLVSIVSIGNIVMADEFIVEYYRNWQNGILVNIIFIAVAIIVSIAGIIAINVLRKNEKINKVLYRVLIIILVCLLIGFIIYEGILIWDYSTVKIYYDYLVSIS